MNNDFEEFFSGINSVENNIIHHRNIISPFANTNLIKGLANSKKVFVDSCYGYSYDENYLQEGAAIYGQAERIPTYSGDQLSNYGFLRVPFRKIPRVWVNDRNELEILLNSIKSNDPNLKIHYRGQPREHLMKREKDTLSILYNDINALEPSLLTSASRKDLHLQKILPVWNGTVNFYIDNILHFSKINSDHALFKKMINFQSSPNFSLFSLALAQHYGLPSAGLDVSPDLDVALFFAFKKFTKTSVDFEYNYADHHGSKEDPPVIYIMVPTDAHQFEFSKLRPDIMPFSRPDAQSAAFMHTGWGLNKNFAATRMFMAIYLNPEGNFGKIKNPTELFPINDPFAILLDKIRRKTKDLIFLKFLEGFYLVK